MHSRCPRTPRALILREYLNDVEALSDRLSSSLRQVDASEEMLARLAHYERIIPGVHLAWGLHNTTESYRRFLSYVFHKLQQTREPSIAPAAYGSVVEFEHDLLLLRKSLQSHRGERLATNFVDPLLRKVHTFGFRLHTLDIRQHARVHAQVLAELEPALKKANQSLTQLTETLSSETRELLATFRIIGELKREYPAQAICQYIISGAETEDDVLNVVRLAKACAVQVEGSSGDSNRASNANKTSNANSDPGLMPVPLFESIDSLRGPAASCAACGTIPSTRLCSIPGDAGRKSCWAIPTPTKTAACSPAPGSSTRLIASCIVRLRNAA